MLALKPVERAEITILVDNVIDFQAGRGREDVKMPMSQREGNEEVNWLWAAHGFSALVQLESQGTSEFVLYDTGQSGEVLGHNFNALGFDLSRVRNLVVSHGHFDHTGGISWVLDSAERKKISLFAHPRALVSHSVFDGEARRVFPTGVRMSEQVLRDRCEEVHLRTFPSLTAQDHLLITGEVQRTTKYEQGFKGHQVLVDERWIDDESVIEDTAIVVRIADRGLVIISGCSHAGIVNIIRHAQRLTEEKRILGVIGGLHLIGRNQKIVPQTVRDLSEITPEIIVPCHCTGWTAQTAIAQRLPRAFVNSSVGARYIFSA
jgi:7,8-dihydropterin-6-yl-methyl-4-(beta-D-ribofuranosyl)aminobenzene 5'-phosphate synthase